MDLIATPKNPIPLGASAGFIKGKRGAKLRFARWPSSLRERQGTVCIFPGRSEFIEKYFEVVGELRRRGFAVAVLDWRGQGGSSRLLWDPLKGYVRSFADYEDDLARFMSEVVLPDCPPPYFALAHSMAATVLFRAATMRGCWFSRMVMTAPMLRIAELPISPGPLSALVWALSLTGFGGTPVPGGIKAYLASQVFEGNLLTSDRERFLRNQSVVDAAPKLAVGPPTIAWLRAALGAMGDIADDSFPVRMRVPVLMLAASDDRIVSSLAIEEMATRLRVGAQLVLRGARHEILQERDVIRQQFWAAFDAFVPGAALSKAS
ncbi:MAG: alpha/beta fold hydrolase [Methyloceanibacter sp.]